MGPRSATRGGDLFRKLAPLAAAGALFLTSCTDLPAPVARVPDEAGPHEALQIRRGKLLSGSGPRAQPIESVSAYCVPCHGTDLDRAGHHAGDFAMRSHPVDLDYSAAAGEDFIPRPELDERLVLLDGKLTCITCHDSRASDHRLVMPDDQSQLCLACHKR